jgi:hypothetical protein
MEHLPFDSDQKRISPAFPATGFCPDQWTGLSLTVVALFQFCWRDIPAVFVEPSGGGGVGPQRLAVLSTPPFGPNAGCVRDRRRTAEFTCSTEPVEHCAMDRAEDTSLGPLGESPVSGRDADLELRRQMPPGTAAGQHVHDRGEQRPLVQRRGPAGPGGADQIRAQGVRRSPEMRSAPTADIVCLPRDTLCSRNHFNHQSHALSDCGVGSP